MKCSICKIEMSDTSPDVRLRNCGGDCLNCMAEAGDPECLADLAHYLKEQFWENFRWLVRETLDQFPEEHEHAYDMKDRLQDSTSCFHPGIPERGEKRGGDRRDGRKRRSGPR